MKNSGVTKTLILDRDGILIKDTHLLTSFADVEPKLQVRDCLLSLAKQNWQFIIASNQTVVSRGLLTEKDCWKLHHKIVELFKPVNFLKSYLCFHHPKASLPEYRQDCDCRKPRPGMINQAINDFSLNKGDTYFVGDRPSDIIAGNLAGVHSLQLMGEKSKSPIIESTTLIEEGFSTPLKSSHSFIDLAEFIESHHESIKEGELL